MAPIARIIRAAGIASQILANSLSSSASVSGNAQANSLMCFPVDSIVSALMTNITAASSITPLIIDNPLNPPTMTTLDALLDISGRLQTITLPTIITTSTTAPISPATDASDMKSAGTMATPTAKATATAQVAAVTANLEAEDARNQAGEVVAAKVAQEQSTDIDPANGPFPGGNPTPLDDVLITAIFLILFGLGAFTHISIYRANAKRGHKFLLSDLMFDFCMVRVMTCIFRIVWVFSSRRGVILAALIFQNGGATVIFAVNLILAQRLVRSLHPAVGWQLAFSYFSLFLILSVPAVIAMNITAIFVSFFSVGKPIQLQVAEEVLKFGVSWNMMLVAMPLLWIFLSSATPRPPPEEFGVCDSSRKASLLVFSATTLVVGAAVKLAALLDPAGVKALSPLFTKSAFYATGFMLEILTVAAYAYFRIDLAFHIPNGASGPGDYSLHSNNKGTRPQLWTPGELEREIGKIGVRYQLLSSRGDDGNKQRPLFALLYPEPAEHDGSAQAELEYQDQGQPRGARVSRRQSLMEAVSPWRPARATRSTMYMTEKLPPSQLNE